MHSCACAHCLTAMQFAEVALPSAGRHPVPGFTFTSRLANASGRIEFNMVLFMDWQFASGCSPPRLSTTQLPSASDSQCSVRRGLSPLCWCALSGALVFGVSPKTSGDPCPSVNGARRFGGCCRRDAGNHTRDACAPRKPAGETPTLPGTGHVQPPHNPKSAARACQTLNYF